MKLAMTLLFSAIFNTISQDFFCGVDASQNDLILNSGDVLEINTTVPSINCTSCSGNTTLPFQNRSSSYGSHLVANITFSGNIEFKSGSIVKVFGKNALSITSLNGNIKIQTDVDMTCGENVFNDTCLGGFTQSSSSEEVGTPKEDIFLGLGPGGFNITNIEFVEVFKQCIRGSSHGGEAGPSYDKNNTKSLLGGSGGSCISSPGNVAGGGAIELVAETGKIVINASIIASAQKASSSSICSGGSGGRIRLKAQKVEIQEKGRLNVNGGDGQQPGSHYRLGGGAGGIIQIIASEGSLAANTSSLKKGAGHRQCDNGVGRGFFLLKANETASPIFASNSFNSKQPYPWGQASCNSRTTAASTSLATSTGNLMTTMSSHTSSTVFPDKTIKDQLSTLRKDVQSIKVSLEQGNEVNISDIREVLNKHQSLASRATLNNDIMDLCLQIFKEYEVMLAKGELQFVQEPLRKLLEAASDCLEERNHAFWKQTREMPNLMQTLEGIFVAVAEGNFSPEINFTISTKIAVAVVVRKDVTSEIKELKIPNYLNIKGKSWNGISDFVSIPKETVANAKENYSYVFLLYKNVEDGLPNNATSGNEDDWLVSSLVMSCFLKLDGKPVYDLSPPANLTFNTSPAEERKRECSFWDFKHRFWSKKGVQELKSNSSSTHTVCQTHHLTSFAILMQHTNIPHSKDDTLALSIITYIGCGVSTAALIITLIIFLSIESLSSERHKIHTNLVVSLLLAYVLFLAGIKETSSKVLCKIIAVFLHYFFLTAFTWMLVEGLHLYLKVVQVFRTENIKMVYYYVFGWGFSIIPVVITLSMKPDSYGNNEVCWLSTEDGTIWAFIGPVVAIIAVNCFVLFMVVKTVISSASAVKSSDHEHIKAGIKGLFVLMPILGVGWILGLFALNKGTIVFVYAFAIINGFQGLLIFLLHCVFNSEVRQAFRRQREKHALSKENDSQYNASFSLSHSDSGSKKISSSNSFEKLRASFSFKRKSTTKVVQVQPVSDGQDVTESSLQVKRAFQDKSPNKLCVTDVRNETTSLNCPMEAEESDSLKMTHLMKQQMTTRTKRSRP